jgi:hypothetical protein
MAPPALGAPKMFVSTTHGTWGRTDDGRFGLTFVGFAFDDTGAFRARLGSGRHEYRIQPTATRPRRPAAQMSATEPSA